MSRNPQVKVTWAEAIRDIIIRAMDRGQLLLIVFLGILVILAFRLPPERLEALALAVVDRFSKLWLLGWVLWFFSVCGWFVHSSWQRRVGAGELSRVTEERNRLQKKVAGEDKIKSSRKNKR